MKQLIIALLAIGFAANAQNTGSTEQQSNQSSAKIQDLQKKDEQKKDIDEEITNARLRAELGSKSKWSFKSNFGYSGSSVERPFDKVRPEYRGTEGAPTPTDLSGTVGINYRITDRDSLSLSTGIAVMTPFHGDYTRSEIVDPTGTQSSKIDRFQVSTPSVSWTRGYKAGGMQMSTSVDGSISTTSSDKAAKNAGYLDFSQTMITELGTSLSAGLYASVGIPLYTGDRTASEEVIHGRQRALKLGLTPFMEYAFNDKVNLRTVFGWFYLSKPKDALDNEDPAALRLSTAYQSVGLGYSVTRDIYLYPNVQFVPFDIRSDRTNVAVSAIINMF